MTGPISLLSTEPVWVPVRNDHPITGQADLTGTTVQLAFMPAGGAPDEADWVPATWEPTAKRIGGVDYWLAVVLVGPDPDAVFTFPAPGAWDVWARVTAGDDAAVLRCSTIRAH